MWPDEGSSFLLCFVTQSPSHIHSTWFDSFSYWCQKVCFLFSFLINISIQSIFCIFTGPPQICGLSSIDMESICQSQQSIEMAGPSYATASMCLCPSMLLPQWAFLSFPFIKYLSFIRWPPLPAAKQPREGVAPLTPAVEMVHPGDLQSLGDSANPHQNQQRLCQTVGMVLPISYPAPSPPCSPSICIKSFFLPSATEFPFCGKGIVEGSRWCPRAPEFFHSMNGLSQAFPLALEKLWSILPRILAKKSNEVRKAGQMWEVLEELSPDMVSWTYLRHDSVWKHMCLIVC